MPCLVIAGHPSAGKTTLALKLKERALKHNAIDEVVILNEESECDGYQEGKANAKQELYETSFAEKQTRGALKAAFDRAVKKTSGSSKRLVILDSMNYIKGFRYELHCISKASGEKHGILWVLNRLQIVQEWNTDYGPKLLRELMSRFEPPDERNRWDKPLFTVDVAPVKDETKAVNSSKTEVLENSVYNMHSLGEAFGTTRDEEHPSSDAPPLETKPKKSAFSRAPKKSAFSRRKKPTPFDKSKKMMANPDNNSFVFDTSLLTTSQQNDETETKPASPEPTTQQPPKEQVSSKSIEEQLDDILNTFLLQTQNLKEGMSTRQYE